MNRMSPGGVWRPHRDVRQGGTEEKVENTVGMVCQTCHLFVNHSDASYRWKMTEEGETYQSCQKEHVQCLYWAMDLAEVFLAMYRQTQHGVIRGDQKETPTYPEEPNTYHIYFPRAAGLLVCTLERCQGWASIRVGIWLHFVHWYMQDTVAILEEGNFTFSAMPSLWYVGSMGGP